MSKNDQPEQRIRVRVQGLTGLLELNRPARANAYDAGMLDLLGQGVARLVADPAVRVVVVTSAVAGKFCGGADLDQMKRMGPADALDLTSLRVFDALAACPKPTIAAVDGPAFGGGLELALACDLRLATPRARFALPETALGLIPAAGATLRLPRVVGEARARQMVLFGQQLDAQQALSWGLVDQLVEADELQQQLARWVERGARGDPLALRLAKRALELWVTDQAAREFARSAQALLYQVRHDPDHQPSGDQGDE